MNHDFVIRKGTPQDAEDFSRLILYTAPKFLLHLFGYRARSLIAQMFRHRNNAFSFEYSHFIEVDGKIAGTVALYDHDQGKQQDLRTIFLVIKNLGWNAVIRARDLLRARKGVAFAKGECHLSYIAIYPKFRGLGFGKALLERIEEEARKMKARRIVLRTDVDNDRAIGLYKKHEYKIAHRMPPLKVRNKDFNFFRISKELASIFAVLVTVSLMPAYAEDDRPQDEGLFSKGSFLSEAISSATSKLDRVASGDEKIVDCDARGIDRATLEYDGDPLGRPNSTLNRDTLRIRRERMSRGENRDDGQD